MFIFKKIYCRIFQQCFHLALPLLPYRDPILKRSLRSIPSILKDNGCSRPMVITDSNISSLGLADGLKAILSDSGLDYTFFDGAFPNPTVDLAYKTHDFYAEHRCDSLIALGGGSPMDLAKLCGVIEKRPGVPLEKLGGILKVRKRLPLIIAIPTTAGTGSEATLAAVVVDQRTGRKFAINDFPLIPRYAILDHTLISSLPGYVAAATGLDALTHAVEAYIGKSTTRLTRYYSEKAVHLIFSNLKDAADHKDPESEKAMLAASHFAGRAFTRSYVGYIHALSHALSGAYDLPHGEANAILLPIVLRRYGSSVHKKLARLAVCAGLGEKYEDDALLAERFISAIEEINKSFGIPDRISAILKKDIPRLSAFAECEANPLYPVPVLWDKKELEDVYKSVAAEPETAAGTSVMEKQSTEKLLQKQRKFFKTGRTLSLSFRKKALKRLYDALCRYESDIAAALRADLGKSAMEAYMCETGLAKSEISYLLKHLDGIAAEKRVRTPLAQYFSRSFTRPVPYGQVLILSPWNYPILLSIEPLADAIAAGNTCILKPGSYAAASSALLKKMLNDIFPEKYVAVVTGGRKENRELLDCDFDYIFFTGSKTVGREVLKNASERIIPVTLELGGKSPCIVDETADLRLAARRIVFGKFLNCGQTCVAPDYIYCAESIKEDLIRELKVQTELQYGEFSLENPAYGKIINKKHYDRIMKLISESVLHGSLVRYGGDGSRKELRIEPTIISDVDWNSAVMGEEIFGPILPVMTYKNIREAAAQIAKRDHPLALYIFSSDKANIRYIKNHVQYGGGCINDTVIHLATPYMGFGGVGASGMGSYHGRAGFDTFSHYKSIVDKKTFFDLPIRYQPYSDVYFRLVKMFVK